MFIAIHRHRPQPDHEINRHLNGHLVAAAGEGQHMGADVAALPKHGEGQPTALGDAHIGAGRVRQTQACAGATQEETSIQHQGVPPEKGSC